MERRLVFHASSSGAELVIDVSGIDGLIQFSLKNSVFETHFDGLSMILWKEDSTLTWNSLSLVGMLVGCDMGRYNCLGSVLPIGVLTELCNECLTISNLEMFFRIFDNIFPNSIHVRNRDVINIGASEAKSDAGVDSVLEALRNQLLEIRIASKIDKATVSCITASWLSNCQALDSDCLADEGVQSIAERIQLLHTSEGTIEDYIKTDTSLLLDAKLCLLNAIRKKPESTSKDSNNSDICSQLWVLLVLSEVFKTTAVYEYCAYLLYTWLVIDGKDGKITKTIKSLNLSDDDNLNTQNTLKQYFSCHVPTNPLQRTAELAPDTSISSDSDVPTAQQRIDYSTYSVPAVPPIPQSKSAGNKSMLPVPTAPTSIIKGISDTMRVDIISSINKFYEIYPTISTSTTPVDSDLLEPSLSNPLPTPEPYPDNPVMKTNNQRSAMKTYSSRYSTNKDSDDAIRPARSASPTSYITPAKATASTEKPHREEEESITKEGPKGNLYDRNGRFIGHKARESRVSFSEPFSRVRSSTPSPLSGMKTPTKDTRTSVSGCYSDPVEGRLRAVERLHDVKRRQNYENTKLAVEESMRISRLKSVELRAIMARVGYGHTSPSNSTSKRTGSIFHRIRVINDGDKGATAKVDTSTSPDTAAVAQRRAQERIKQHKLDMERRKESDLQAKKAKELLKWQERDRKIQLFVERQAVVNAAEASSTKSKNVKYVVSEPWNHGSPWMLNDPRKQAMEKKSHSIDALRAVGLAPLDDAEYETNQRGQQVFETRANTMSYDDEADGLTIEDDNSVHYYEHIQYDAEDDELHAAKPSARCNINTLFSPTSVTDAGGDHSPTDYVVSVNILRAWNLPTDLLGSTNPYVVLDWGKYGRACSFAIMNSTQPNFNCVVRFKSPLETASRKEIESASPQHLVYVNRHPFAVAADTPIMKAYIYSRNESISDELLGEGEINMGKVLHKVYSKREKANEAASTCVLNLYDMSSQFTGNLELRVGIKDCE